ncbi:MAG: sensor histidine kinase [Gaiellaceae bacterium]
MRVLRLALAPLGIAFGLAVEWAFYDSTLGLALAVADFAAGFLLIVAGSVAWDRRGESRVGALMTLAGFSWFLGNVGGAAVYFHRGPLVHLVLSYPSGRLRGNVARVVVVAAYVDALVQPLASNDTLTLVLAAAVVFAALRTFLTSSGPARRAGAPALCSALGLGAVLALAAVSRLEVWGHRDAVLLTYDIVIVSITLVLLVDLLRGHWVERAVSGLVVDLGAISDTVGLRGRLARALGDPSLQLGYRLAETGGFVDDAARPLALPAQGSGRSVTRLEERGEQIGVLVHDDALLDDPALIHSVAAAAQLALANVRLQAALRAQAAELESSRRRIIATADRPRQRLQRQLREGPERLLESALVSLGDAASAADENDAPAISALETGLGDAREELRAFAQGIRPSALSEGGLMPALTVLAQHAPLPIELHGAVARLPESVEATMYFVCSEGLANAIKHAQASRIAIDVHQANGTAVVAVSDDGRGGASVEAGSGLRGLADRVEALGGWLEVESSPGAGTRVIATLPVSLFSGPESMA